MPRFLMTLTSQENSSAGDPPPELFQAIGELAEKWGKAGVLLDTGGLAPTAMSTRLRLSAGKITATDGPFTDTKEVTTAYAIIKATTPKDATDYATQFLNVHKKHWPSWDGGSEVRQIFGPDDAEA
jgi:hypothetical protein